MRRLKPVLNYFSSLTNDDMITFLSSLNAMVSLSLFPASISTISPSPKSLCITLSPMENFAIYFINLSMVFLPSSDSEKWEIIRWTISPIVKSYLILISFKFFWFLGVVRNDRKTCFLLILLQQFINSVFCIALFGKKFYHPMNNIANRETKVLVDCFQMLMILNRGVEW